MAAATTAFRARARAGRSRRRAARRLLRAARLARARSATRWSVASTSSTRRDLDAVRAALRPTTRARVARDAGEPDVGGHRHRRGRRARARAPARGCRVDSTCATPVHTPAARARRRPRRCTRRRSTSAATPTCSPARSSRAPPTTRGPSSCTARRDEGACLGPVEAWLLLRGMRTLFARVERQSATALRLAHAARGAARRDRAAIPGCRAPAARGRGAPDARRVRRHAVDPDRRRRGARARGDRQAARVGAGDVARRRREPGRAPRDRRGPDQPDAARSAAAVGRARARGRPVRRSRRERCDEACASRPARSCPSPTPTRRSSRPRSRAPASTPQLARVGRPGRRLGRADPDGPALDVELRAATSPRSSRGSSAWPPRRRCGTRSRSCAATCASATCSSSPRAACRSCRRRSSSAAATLRVPARRAR